MYRNEPTTPTARRTILNVRANTLTMIGFGVFVAVALPLVLCALFGAKVDAVLWVVPFVIPAVLEMRRLLVPAMTPEEARQSADISRWEV